MRHHKDVIERFFFFFFFFFFLFFFLLDSLQIRKQSFGFFCITKTCLYNFDPLKPHFYIAKLGFTVVYIIFLMFAQKHRLWVPTIYVLRNMKNIRVFYMKIFRFLVVKFSIYLNRRVFVMVCLFLSICLHNLLITISEATSPKTKLDSMWSILF